MDRLRRIGLLGESEHQDLRQAYVFWRGVADGLRMVRGNARDLLLPEDGSEEQGFLARRLGYAGASGREAGQALAHDVAHHQDRVRGFFDARFAPAGTAVLLDPLPQD